jgi:mediator of RNA polymerase II transcription subunit 14
MVVIAREVAQMDKKWNDVRLLSFDLQTVEFAYAMDYSVSISCTDQLSGGLFDLRFSRCPHAPWITNEVPPDVNNQDLFNPHDDTEPFMRNILRHGRLAPSLHRLVGLLRDTLPIVAELEDIRVQAEKDGASLDTFAKSVGWYRVLYGDLIHALDFRLMTDQRVVILDGSRSLFLPINQLSIQADGSGNNVTRPPATSNSQDQGENTSSLQPIPGFDEIILDAIRDVTSTGTLGKVAPIDVGVVCDASSVRAIGRAIHDRVRARLMD